MSSTQSPTESVYYSSMVDLDVDFEAHVAHVSECPGHLSDFVAHQESIVHLVSEVNAAQGADEPAHAYSALADLLTTISEHIHSFVVANDVGALQVRFLRPLVFVRYNPYPHFTSRTEERGVLPIIGLHPFDGFSGYPRDDEGRYSDIPGYHMEALVDATAIHRSSGQSRGRDYVQEFLRRCPNRPGVYCLSVYRGGFSVHFADSSGAEGSPIISWDDGDAIPMLVNYVYSLYVPPAGHFSRDPTMTWRYYPGSKTLWTVQCGGEEFPNMRPLFLAAPWGKRSAIFVSGGRHKARAVIKDSYRDPKAEYYEEPQFLKHIHCRGFVPGVVRLAREENVVFSGQQTEIISVRDSPRVKHRMVLADVGESLLRARSVNDLLMAIYDVLEVHRTLASRAKILHRDMSLANILMYPKWASCSNSKLLEGAPPLIDDILSGQLRDAQDRLARCLLIDFDYAVRLPDMPDQTKCEGAISRRVGTPRYVARATAAGRVLHSRNIALPMPELSGEALDLYLRAYGQNRYEQYCDDARTFHGGRPQEPDDDIWASAERVKRLPYVHRWDYDIESVYWTVYSVLLLVRPQGYWEDERSQRYSAMRRYWKILASHDFLDLDTDECENLPQDTRAPLLECDLPAFLMPFPPEMEDVGRLMFSIAQHVRVSYAAMVERPPRDDHLHEAVQRLILDYLVVHRNEPIRLTPDSLRYTQARTAVVESQTGDPSSEEGDVSMDFEDLLDLSDTASGSSTEDNQADSEGCQDPRAGPTPVSSLLQGDWEYPYFAPEQCEIGEIWVRS
ncbi:hypothetical protein C8Q79DRAFT_153997 [Trametes meyenii]|nr:hypothetical protein C8Q79DRAFT_153997 [Trametes meyenii]